LIGQHHILPRELPPELALLLSAIRHCAGGSNQKEIPFLNTQSLDWARLQQLAARHRVSPMLYLGLRQSVWSMVPEEIQVRLKSRFVMNLKRNFRLTHHATRVVEAFNKGGIHVIPYKGVFLAESFYGQLSRRETNDIDLLIAPKDAAVSDKLLKLLGFLPTEKLDQQQIYRDPVSQIEIDLHWQLTPAYFPVDYDFEQLWGRTIPEKLGSTPYRTLANEDLLLFLCIQVAKDSWERQQRLEQLQKVCDIAEVISKTPDMDWKTIRQSVTQQGLSRVVNFALALASGLLNISLPDFVSAEVARDRTGISLARQACALPSLAETRPAPAHNSLADIPLRLRQLHFYLQLREQQRHKWQYVARMIGAMTWLTKSQ